MITSLFRHIDPPSPNKLKTQQQKTVEVGPHLTKLSGSAHVQYRSNLTLFHHTGLVICDSKHFQKILQGIQSDNSLDPNHARHFVRPDLGPSLSQ